MQSLPISAFVCCCSIALSCLLTGNSVQTFTIPHNLVQCSTILNTLLLPCFRVFLVRESQSLPGSYVLSLAHAGKVKHCTIKSVSNKLHSYDVTAVLRVVLYAACSCHLHCKSSRQDSSLSCFTIATPDDLFVFV